MPARAILIERGTPRHVDARAFANACGALFGAPLCVTHLRSFDTLSASIVAGRVIGHNRGGLVVDVAGSDGFVPRRHSLALRTSFLSEEDAEALLARQRGRLVQLQQIERGDGRRPVYREGHPDESVVLDVDAGQRCRAIHLPSEKSLGTLHVYLGGRPDLNAPHDRRPAAGIVIVPSSSFVWLEVEAPGDLRPLASLGRSDL